MQFWVEGGLRGSHMGVVGAWRCPPSSNAVEIRVGFAARRGALVTCTRSAFATRAERDVNRHLYHQGPSDAGRLLFRNDRNIYTGDALTQSLVE